jgi:recombination protein RecR
MMNAVPEPLERLIEAFTRLPGIGPKTASRLTYYLLRAPEFESKELARALGEVREATALCVQCYSFTSIDHNPCPICSAEGRSARSICVVEEPLDVLAIEKTGLFKGHYHVLHGAISPVEGISPDDLRVDELLMRLEKNEVDELILATNPTLEGEATAMYIKQKLERKQIRITRLARGLPSGGDLEYADSATLSQAMEGRSEY